MEIAIIICGALLLGFWGMAAIMHICDKHGTARIEERKADCVAETTATVQDIKEVCVRIVDDYSYTWYPIYEYYTNGELVVQQSEFGGAQNTFQKGQQVTLYYNPNNPQEIFVPDEKPETASKIFRIMSVVCFIFGVLVIIAFLVLLIMEMI